MQSRTLNIAPATAAKTLRIGSVSFLNAKPLIEGLEHDASIELSLDVPSKLLEDLQHDLVDVALLPVIDYQRMPNLCIVPAGGIGCDGETLTVRIFSKLPINQIHTIACDTDSHTSVALARIIFAEQFHITPDFIDWNHEVDQPADAMLLIGDKVVCEEPSGYPHQLDLGQAWKNLTSLPFVFAVWTARKGIDLRDLPERLSAARVRGLQNVDVIIKRFAIPRGWPVDLARKYLMQHLHFEIGDAQLQAIGLFHQLAAKNGIIPAPVRPLELYAVD